MNIRSLQHTLAYNQVGFQRIQVDMNKLLDCWFRDIESLDRKVKVNKDLHTQEWRLNDEMGFEWIRENDM